MTRLASLALAALALVACETVPPCEPHDSDKCRIEALERRVKSLQTQMIINDVSNSFERGWRRSEQLRMQQQLQQQRLWDMHRRNYAPAFNVY